MRLLFVGTWARPGAGAARDSGKKKGEKSKRALVRVPKRTGGATTVSAVREMLDVLGIGAGPGGIAAALTAADAGNSVVCVDKATFPRDKTCGDGLTAGALRALEALGLSYEAFA